MNIPLNEISYSRLSVVDIGRVFLWKGRLFRAFPESAKDAVGKLFDCGLVDALVSRGLLVVSKISDYQLDGYSVIVEHETISKPTYPREWSFSMLQDAARLVLDLNECARHFGYQTKDCNGYNVLFNQGRPVFVDLSSLIEISSRSDRLYSYDEFLLSYYFPLQLWCSAGKDLGSRCTPRAVGQLMRPHTYFRYRWRLFRHISDSSLQKFFRTLVSLRILQHNDFQRLRVRVRPWFLFVLRLIARSGTFGRPARISFLDKNIEKMVNRTGSSAWSDYHDGYQDGPNLTLTPRFKAILERVAALNIESIIEFGGNQGVLSRLVKAHFANVQIVCTDPDEAAIDKGYRRSKRSGEKIDWAIFNPFAYETSPAEIRPDLRFQAECVFALALTHHLTISQRFRLDHVFDVLATYATKFVFIEFMPLGLYAGGNAPPIPDWYNEAWFTNEFRKRFELIERIQLEQNRILFIGAISIEAKSVV